MFICACNYNNLNIIQLLSNHKKININEIDCDGNIAFHIVCKNHYLDAIKILLKSNILNINIKIIMMIHH